MSGGDMTNVVLFPTQRGLDPIVGAVKRIGDARETLKAAYDAIGRIPFDDDALTKTADAIPVQMLKDLDALTRKVRSIGGAS